MRSSAVVSAGIAVNPWRNIKEGIGDQGIFSDTGSNVLIDPIVPIHFFSNRKEEMLQQIIEIKKTYGLKRFLITAPGNGIKLFPKPEVYQRIGETVLEVKKELQRYGIEIGWWCAPSIRSGYSSRFQYYVTDLSGRISNTAPCPLDPTFREEFSDNFAKVVDIAKPSLTQIEDDFLLSWQPPNVTFGCFCPLHLAEFSRRQGRDFTREELKEVFSKSDVESINLRRKWAELSCDTLADFAKLVRQKVDKVSPQTRISLCQASNSDFDGDFTEAVARAFAGNTRPITRLHGTSYASDVAITLPSTIFHALYSRQHLPADIECIHESDTYPHLRFFMSATKMKSLMTAAFAYGLNDSLFYPVPSADNMLEERGYLEMFKSEVKRFSKIKEEVANAPVIGCEIIHLPFASCTVPYKSAGSRPRSPMNPWVHVLGRLGIPYTTNKRKVKAVAGDDLKFMTDKEIKELLRSAVILDGYAAYVLSQKGYGKLIGTEVEPGETTTPGGVITFAFEGVRDVEKHKNLKAKLMRTFTYIPGDRGGKNFYVLRPNSEAEIITDFLDTEEKQVMPASIQFKNEWGGRVYVTAYNLQEFFSVGFFNYVRKELMRETIEWLGEEQLPVFVNDLPNIFCICNGNNDNTYLLVNIINLCSDESPSISIDVPTDWKDATVSQLQGNGEWTRVGVKRYGRTISLKIKLMIMEPITIKLSK